MSGRPRSTSFPYTTLFRSVRAGYAGRVKNGNGKWGDVEGVAVGYRISRGDVGRWLFEEVIGQDGGEWVGRRSEEHTSELQSRFDLVCRLLLEKKKRQPACE